MDMLMAKADIIINSGVKEWVGLAVGGFLGAFARYLSSGWLQRVVGVGFPVGTLFVNLAGCFLVGWVSARAGGRWIADPAVKAFFVTGFCGAFTTFSTFMFETDYLLRSGNTIRALAYLCVSICAGWLLFRAGVRVGAAL